MAQKENSPDDLAKKTFLITVIGALLYIGVVFAFVIGGNRREEAAHVDGAKTPTLQVQNRQAE
ncbi:MAG TPA: hypothetical protein VJR89_22945 [Polyangiales bacterium]|nr:hypothetical protein [Polyangiales bacterium]